ncbi:DUF1853 family protein [Undibacterium sp. Jales W-56]|uniref:DUF1853 family protein n=1 Tax=Undibacterium sp. Jales W-56 TaxID=2897325 RepID=UPI0021CF843A|nr:DUF1853 family protein [Undibacterium sp. Jales W-56]MCU6433512.1 DUF1853 family protein [Undibacterium sp. Jales W-56]
MTTYQNQFHRQWQHLHDRHVRALVWLLTSPSLLAANLPHWQDKIADIVIADETQFAAWIADLDRHPQPLYTALARHQQRRLGRYAENLLAFYLQHQHILYAQNVQIQNTKQTLGEFDFLLHHAKGLLHWELATKFYVHVADQGASTDVIHLRDYLGPNLVDTLSGKLHKVFDQQLQLSLNPAATSVLPLPVVKAQALIKGWLFYRTGWLSSMTQFPPEIAPAHCNGYWWTIAEVEQLDIAAGLLPDRLDWFAPAQAEESAVLHKAALCEQIRQRSEREKSPVLLTIMSKNGGLWQESCRGMVVPDHWLASARQRRSENNE